MNLKAALKSMRLRTLPLSTGGVLLGILLATADWRVDIWTAVLIVLTTVCLQILSNLSNELGDVLRGTDTPDRQGPQYGLNGGDMTVGQMKVLIGTFVGFCIVFGTLMTWRAFGTLFSMTPILVLMLGAAAIMGAMKYTLGRNPYGYRAKGDFYVFLFFGLVAVLGAYFVCTAGAGLHWKLLLPASAIGFFSVGVLNVNNIRDMKTDARNRVTVAIKLGERNAKIYQTVLIGLGWACMIAYCLLCWPSVWHWLWALTLPLYILHLRGVWTRHDKALDPMLPLLVMSTFLLSILAGVGFCAHLF
ncbi:MAG: 1,4-dihydroxy-2-naphthoate octaprenyltransferase [Bacteroidales bacterium]|nr:1,4-dihydroxy-2-naphthoate octaprenyltransferase [Bacteroidales bacterium]MBR1571008.1 1,4-dihydroxy-2-naphthoate octaprenyltransferase [Bacteroidales bacterium]